MPVELETEDPLKSLKSKSIHDRCAAARDLSLVGTPEQIPPLVRRARDDKSPAVRLATAGSIADILSRYRLAPRRSELDDDARQALLDGFKGIDPGRNAGLFPMFACLDVASSFTRIATGLRDPRGGVRVGAAVGLLRLCLTEAHNGDAELEQQVVALLDDSRLRPDALAEVARVCAACGYVSGLPRLQALGLGGAQGEFVDQMVAILLDNDAPLAGIWRSDGRDALQIDPEPAAGPADLVPAADGGLLVNEAGAWRSVPAAEVTGFRKLHFRRVGAAEAAPALQALGRTWYPADADALDGLIAASVDVQTLDWSSDAPLGPAHADLADALLPHLGDTAAEDRAAAVLHQGAGRRADALARLEAATSKKKCPPDSWFFLGEARHAAGDADGARAAWEAATKKNRKKKAWPVPEAKARLGIE